MMGQGGGGMGSGGGGGMYMNLNGERDNYAPSSVPSQVSPTVFFVFYNKYKQISRSEVPTLVQT